MNHNIIVSPEYNFSDLENATSIKLVKTGSSDIVIVNLIKSRISNKISIEGTYTVTNPRLPWSYDRVDIYSGLVRMSYIELSSPIYLINIKQYVIKLVVTDDLIIEELSSVSYDFDKQLGSGIINESLITENSRVESYSSANVLSKLKDIRSDHPISNNYLDPYYNEDSFTVTSKHIIGRSAWGLLNHSNVLTYHSELSYDNTNNKFINYEVIGTQVYFKTALDTGNLIDFNLYSYQPYLLNLLENEVFIDMSSTFIITSRRYVRIDIFNQIYYDKSLVSLYNNSGKLVVIKSRALNLLESVLTDSFKEKLYLFNNISYDGFKIIDVKFNILILTNGLYNIAVNQLGEYLFPFEDTIKVINNDQLLHNELLVDIRKGDINIIQYQYSKSPSDDFRIPYPYDKFGPLSGDILNPVWIGNLLYSKNINSYKLI